MSALRAVSPADLPASPPPAPAERTLPPKPDAGAPPTMPTPANGSRRSGEARLRRSVRFATAAILFFALGLGIFMGNTVIAGAVIGQGTLAVKSGPKKVQHPTGGVVDRLFVAEGERVAAGQPLVSLDSTVANARLKAVAAGIVQNQAKLDRLTAERDGARTLDFPSVPADAVLRDPAAEDYLDGERRQFEFRRAGREGERAQIGERIRQTEDEVRGLEAQLDAVREQVRFADANVEGSRSLFRQKLATRDILTTKEQARSELAASRASLEASIAASRGKIAELRLNGIQAEQNFRARTSDELAQTRLTLSQLVEQQIAAADAVRRNLLVAPQDGTVHELAVRTVGGVVQPAETLMLIVPDADRLVGEVHMRPSDIDQLHVGQEAEIHFSAFDRGTTPSLKGAVASISPDLVPDARGGAPFYLARIDIPDREVARLDGLRLMPGMPVEVFVRTGERRIVSYILKPLTDQMARAFR